MTKPNESTVENAALTCLRELGYAIGHGPHLAPDEPAVEQDSFGQVVLMRRLREAIQPLDHASPNEAKR